mmetsp:Transcript_7331/g.17204  ORF Transcript_7331/g.17204 Transcript_7331/m.17204 type:complete len:209 (+) Transcript_7331:465-1091(+)
MCHPLLLIKVLVVIQVRTEYYRYSVFVQLLFRRGPTEAHYIGIPKHRILQRCHPFFALGITRISASKITGDVGRFRVFPVFEHSVSHDLCHYGCRRTRRIVCVRFAFYHKLDVREFSFQLAPIALWIAHRVDVRLPHLDVSLIDDVSNQCNGRIVAHLVQVVNLGGFSKHVAGYFRRQNGTQGVPNLGMVYQLLEKGVPLYGSKYDQQ